MEYVIGQDEDITLSIAVGERSYTLRLYDFRGLTYCDITYDDEVIVAGKRVMANQWILPMYMMEDGGNFRFETYEADKEEYVNHEGFDTKFRLNAYSTEEVEEIEANS